MAMIDPTGVTVVCDDCSHSCPEATLLSFSTFAPPPDNYSYDGSCAKCGSKNTNLIDGDEMPPF